MSRLHVCKDVDFPHLSRLEILKAIRDAPGNPTRPYLKLSLAGQYLLLYCLISPRSLLHN
jgi:hypothetical protein